MSRIAFSPGGRSASARLSAVAGGAAALFLSVGCHHPDDGSPADDGPLAARAVAFAGGEDALRGMRGFQLEVSGTRLVAGEGQAAGDPALEASAFVATVSYDAAGDGLRIDYDRAITLFGGVPMSYSEIYGGELGYIEGVESLYGGGNWAMFSSRWASGRKQHELLNPHVLLREILDDPGRAVEAGAVAEDGTTFEILEVADAVHPIQLWVADDGRIARATTLVNDFLYRDTVLEVEYEGWQRVGDLQFPEVVTVTFGPDVIHRETRTRIAVDPAFDASTFAIPQSDPPAAYNAADALWGEQTHQMFQQFASVGLAFDFRQETVVPVEIAPGIVHLTGGVHNSLAVEQEAGVVIVEAPNYPERGDEILAWAAREFPGKPVTHVIATHHHMDHSAGLRAFVAGDATVVLHADSAAFFRDEIFTAPSTVAPDSLAVNPRAPRLETVARDGSITLDDATRPVHAYHVATSHTEDMLVVYVPLADGGGVLFESDLYNPGNGALASNPAYAQELVEAIETVGGGLDVSLIAGGHGAVAPTQELIDFLSP